MLRTTIGGCVSLDVPTANPGDCCVTLLRILEMILEGICNGNFRNRDCSVPQGGTGCSLSEELAI